MDFWSALQLYIVVAAALAGTSYWNLYRPAVQLLEEIMEDYIPSYRGWPGAFIWFGISFVAAPVVAIVLLSNNNNEFIEKLAVTLAKGIIDE